MVAANPFILALALATTALSRAFVPQTPNPAPALVKRAVHFPEGCDMICNWEGDKPELPECTWEMCMDNVRRAKCKTPEIESADDYSDEERWNSVYSMFLYKIVAEQGNTQTADPFTASKTSPSVTDKM